MSQSQLSEPHPDFKLTAAQERASEVLRSDATHVALGGGSRSGKTFLLLRAVLVRAIREANSRHAVFRFHFNSIKAAVINDTLPKVMRLCFPDLPSSDSMMNKTDFYMTLPNGSEVWFGGLDTPERSEKILGQEFATIYFNEASQIPYNSMLLALTRLAQQTKLLKLRSYTDLNPNSKRAWVYQRFVMKRDPFSKMAVSHPQDYGFYLLNPADNMENLDPGYLRILEAMPTKERNRFLLGQFADDADGALWTDELLHQQRHLGGEPLPQWLRIVIAVDPSGCSGPEDYRSDEIGIVVLALGTDSKCYVLEDLSGRYSPESWGKVVAEAFSRHNADRVVAEKNFGGDMVRAIVHAANPDIPYKEVTASRGKVVRAEPVASLYEQGKVLHVGYFTELEDQMCSMNQSGYVGLKSPDRLDALVWGVTELFPKITSASREVWVPPAVHVGSRSASRFDRAQVRR